MSVLISAKNRKRTIPGSAAMAPVESNILDVHIEAVEEVKELENPPKVSFLFCIDVSGSMEDSVPDLKATLFALRDTLSGSNDDTNFASNYDVSIVTFNDSAKLVWSSRVQLENEQKTYTDAVQGIKAERTTNMGAGLQICFANLNPDADYTCLFLMTDGESNTGMKTINEFKRFMTANKNDKVKVFSFGYGKRYDSKVLEVCGEFSHIENNEFIPVVVGSVIGESTSTFGNSALVGYVPPADEMIDDSLKLCVGKELFGSLFTGRKYRICYESKEPLRGSVRLSYFDVITKQTKTVDVQIEDGEPVDGELLTSYYQTKKNEIMEEVLRRKANYESKEVIVEYVKSQTEAWNCEISMELKRELLEKIETLTYRDFASSRSDMDRQMNYSTGIGLTPAQSAGAIGMRTASDNYRHSMSPGEGQQLRFS